MSEIHQASPLIDRAKLLPRHAGLLPTHAGPHITRAIFEGGTIISKALDVQSFEARAVSAKDESLTAHSPGIPGWRMSEIHQAHRS